MKDNNSRYLHYRYPDAKCFKHDSDYMRSIGHTWCYRVSTRPRLMRHIPTLYYGLYCGMRKRTRKMVYPTWGIMPHSNGLPF